MAKEGGGGVAASGAPQYGYGLFARDASANSAIRTINGQRKHLDHILVDRLRANELTYGVVAGDERLDEPEGGEEDEREEEVRVHDRPVRDARQLAGDPRLQEEACEGMRRREEGGVGRHEKA